MTVRVLRPLDVLPAAAIPPAVVVALTSETGPIAPVGSVLFPSEKVLLLTVQLPSMPSHQRSAAVRFAVEEQIAASLDTVHVALGTELARGTFLVGVVAHDALEAEAAAAQAAGLRLLPDVLAVPVPAAGGWSVWSMGQRILVRLPDGGGFATTSGRFKSFWELAGRPQLAAAGGQLPPGVPLGTTGVASARGADHAASAFDLCTGRYAASSSASRRTLRAVGAVAAVALGLHTGLAAIDRSVLNTLADSRAEAIRATLTAMGEPVEADLDAAVARRLAPASVQEKDGFLALMSRLSGVLAASPVPTTMQSLQYAGTDGSLAIMLLAPDLASLQTVGGLIADGGMTVSSGAATTNDGGAEVRMTVQAGDR